MAHTHPEIRTRFAPSPTGFVHIGSLRTALFAFLFARKNSGKLILRIEDTDQNRFVEGAVENLLKVMQHLGINFDEGFYLDDQGKVQEKGEKGPYLQSQRLELYKKYALELVEKGSAYYCFCDEQRLEEVRKEQIALKKPPMYDRLCRKLTPEEVREKLNEAKAQGKNPVIRQAIPEGGSTLVPDLVYGEMTYEHRILDDQVILKSDGFPTYHLAVVVDDHFMEISHVIRGEEWIPSTPKHILLYQALGWAPPEFAHVPLILNPDKSKLSKRQGDVAVEDFLSKGYLKEALINFVAFLGWNPKTDQEIFSLQELIEQFDLKKINKSAAIFDLAKLDWLNSLYIRNKPLRETVALALPFWELLGINTESYPKEYLSEILTLEKDRLKKLSEIGERTKYFFAQPEYEKELLIWKKADANDASHKLQKLYEFFTNLPEGRFQKTSLEEELKKFIGQNGFDNGSVLWPLRTCLTGMAASPGPFEVAATLFIGLGKTEILKRIKIGIDKLA